LSWDIENIDVTKEYMTTLEWYNTALKEIYKIAKENWDEKAIKRINMINSLNQKTYKALKEWTQIENIQQKVDKIWQYINEFDYLTNTDE
jgi:hypothetical protein